MTAPLLAGSPRAAPTPLSTALLQALFAATIFTSAFLLFLVQPLIAKQVLPWFGGSAAVWSICMVFFQVVLLGGYAYADALTRHCDARWQARIHIALLLASLACLPIVTDPRWKPTGAEDPTLWILGLLLGTIGLPYFLLSTTGPLLQSWLTRTPFSARVYRYFALSNLASLAALLAYPLVIERHSTLLEQAHGWSWAYALFVLLCSGVTAHAATRPVVAPLAASRAGSPTLAQQALWLALPALGSWLLLAITNHLTQNVAVIPFLWVLPLSVYLLSFVLCFESDRWYRRGLFLPLGAVLLGLGAFGLQHPIGSRLQTAIPLYVAALFVLCMVLHGEMARRRPAPQHLTRFYLMLSVGGAVGGMVVGLIAPLVLPAFYELGIGLVLTALLASVLLRGRRFAVTGCLALALFCAYFLQGQVRDDVVGARRLQRNFYGTLITLDTEENNPVDDVRQMYHGSVKHGEQYLAKARRQEPTTYYGPESGIGRALASAPAGPRRVGLIGLGAGTLATYGRAGDVYRIYEINPQVFELADQEFSFLADSPATLERVLGDARLALEREPPQRFDVLAVDAFSGDAVPIHLITVQAMDAYLRHLQPGGIVAFHVTNRFLSLAPVVQKIAQARGLHAVLVHDAAEHTAVRATDWVLVSRSPQALRAPAIRDATTPFPVIAGLQVWTDDFNNLFDVLK